MFLGKVNCVGDKHFLKNSMIKGDSGNYLKSGTFFLNIVVFPFTIMKGAVHVSKTSESVKYFALTTNFTALHIYFHFTLLYYLFQTTVYFMYDSVWASLRYVVNEIYYFVLIVYFTVLDYMFLKRLVRTTLFRLINKF